MNVDMILLREALEASWDEKTAYLAALREGNPAWGQCYPTSRVVQLFFPEAEIVEGEVWTGSSAEKHFWNVMDVGGFRCHLDFTWRQFPPGSVVRGWKICDRQTLGDSAATIERVELLYRRVQDYLAAG